MMGLTDKIYYIGWFIFNALVVSLISFFIVAMITVSAFENSSFIILVIMCIVYGLQLFGFSFTIVALLPSKKASATAASLIHLYTYYIVYIYKGFGVSVLKKAVISCFVPNVALGFMLDHLLHVEIDGGVGLTIQTALYPYGNFNFLMAFACQIFCDVFWALLGLYLDKVMPKEFGKREPWNFICKKN